MVVVVNGIVAAMLHGGGWDWLAVRAPPEEPSAQEAVADQSACVAWGPFMETASMSPLIAEIEAAGGEVDVIAHRFAATPSYLLLVGPEGSFEVARRIREEFESQSIASHLVPRGPFARSLEVGIFADRARALAQQARIVQLGYVVDLHELKHSPAASHLVARLRRELARMEPPAANCGVVAPGHRFL